MQHPLQLLDLNDDVLLLICAAVRDLTEPDPSIVPRPWLKKANPMKNLSLTCKHIRELCLPYLFSCLRLHSQVADPWSNALRRIDEWNSAHAKYASEVFICINIGWILDPVFPPSLPARLIELLQTVASTGVPLEKLTLAVHDREASAFANAFASCSIVFPDMRVLIICPSLHTVVRCCPRTQVLRGWNFNDRDDSELGRRFVYEAKGLVDLRCFVLYEGECCLEITELRDTVSHVSMLIIPAFRYAMRALGDVETFISHLSQMPSVKVLCVPPARLGEAEERNKENKRVYQDRLVCENRYASMLFERCSDLRELWFSEMTKVTRGEDGELVWARDDQTGRPIWRGMMEHVTKIGS
ncbi:hypothetical protein BDW22DRAFT_1351888 [Trametopsis cervina]|nr:hypothetical protein BDW22DRAFT_1351888 [Trametopsis cervina]